MPTRLQVSSYVMSKESYKSSVIDILQPMLLSFGFIEVELSSCISYEALYRRGRQWFGTSFDYRDQYIEVDLGHLYWFKDVMPRVIVMGEYAAFCDFSPDHILKTEGVESVLNHVRDSFGAALETYKEVYDQVLNKCLRPPKGKYRKEYVLMLGHEVKDDELERFYS